ncbi:MAG: hypothetical protein RIA09_08840 [Hoeflea sp.]|uniref:hypothetical protein n=1 Tax=Hoeflea sp. TaxID=1940281 RepID=UPI0032EE590F
MSAINGPLLLPLSSLVDDQFRAPSTGAPAARAGMQAAHAPAPSPDPVPAARTPAPFRLPVWPSPGAITLAQDLLDLSQTTFAYTATISRPESGPDFWDMLAAALPEPERE